MLHNQELSQIKQDVYYALSGAKIDVRYTKEFFDKNPTESNREFYRKATHNMEIVEECSMLLNDLIIDEDSNEET